MVSAVLAEDSSSASVNPTVSIRTTEWASAGILRIFPAEGPSFLTRVEDLGLELAELVIGNGTLSEEDSERLALASRYYAAERDAMVYLARSEHSRFQLSLKLMKKGFEETVRERALDRLEHRNALSDSRFADAWIRSRTSRKNEGRGKLLSGLLSRGISGDLAREAIERRFADTDERTVCLSAIAKLDRTGRTGDRLIQSLMRKGFSLSLIQSCLKMREE